MANTKSAKKNVRKNLKRYQINLNRKSSIKTAIKKVLNAITNKEKIEKVKELMRCAESEIGRAKSKTFHKNNVSRKISRLAKRVSNYQKEQTATANK